MGDLSDHFSASEFACKCGCGFGTGVGDVSPRLLIACEGVRRTLGSKPLRVLSGCRCEKHNRDCGGEECSAHLRGNAADLSIETGYRKFVAFRSAASSGAVGIGIYPWGLHLDVDGQLPRPSSWSGANEEAPC